MDTKYIGWAAGSMILLAVLLQLKRQWDAGTAKGVSPYLHIGTALGNAGFCAHGVLAGDAVVALTSGALVLTSLAGVGLWALHHRREHKGPKNDPSGDTKNEETSHVHDEIRFPAARFSAGT